MGAADPSNRLLIWVLQMYESISKVVEFLSLDTRLHLIYTCPFLASQAGIKISKCKCIQVLEMHRNLRSILTRCWEVKSLPLPRPFTSIKDQWRAASTASLHLWSWQLKSPWNYCKMNVTLFLPHLIKGTGRKQLHWVKYGCKVLL